MLTAAEAIAAIVAEVQALPVQHVPLAEALGLVLAQDAIADVDSPPFDKSLMDGYAVRAADLPDGRATLRVIEEVVAGQVAVKSVGSGEAIRIMTGAPIPAGADAVVPVEQTRLDEADPHEVAIDTTVVKPGKSILPRAASVRKGACVLSAGRKLRAQELGALAELGHESIRVHRRPRAAVLATGDELVPVSEAPGPGQIRNSNETMLVAQLQKADCQAVRLGIARDNLDSLREKIAEGLNYDLLLLSGGVSAGKLDLVPQVLAEFGVRQVFHKVRIKPGQPLWFGVYDPKKTGFSPKPGFSLPPNDEGPCAVFGLPGNPVSSMVCCELFAQTAVRRLMGFEPSAPQPVQARLGAEHFNGGNRPTYHPARLDYVDGCAVVRTVPWIGSADLCATIEANAIALFPEGDTKYSTGTLIDVFPW